jgi:hypothetical protein
MARDHLIICYLDLPIQSPLKLCVRFSSLVSIFADWCTNNTDCHKENEYHNKIDYHNKLMATI